MKTLNELNSLIPQLIDLVFDNPKIGDCHYGRCEDETEENWEDNSITYEEDGWNIEIGYRCCGDDRNSWGEITDLSAYHYDEETDEETEFSDEDLYDIWSAIEKRLACF